MRRTSPSLVLRADATAGAFASVLLDPSAGGCIPGAHQTFTAVKSRGIRQLRTLRLKEARCCDEYHQIEPECMCGYHKPAALSRGVTVERRSEEALVTSVITRNGLPLPVHNVG
jgi:hypothetical protein